MLAACFTICAILSAALKSPDPCRKICFLRIIKNEIFRHGTLQYPPGDLKYPPSPHEKNYSTEQFLKTLLEQLPISKQRCLFSQLFYQDSKSILVGTRAKDKGTLQSWVGTQSCTATVNHVPSFVNYKAALHCFIIFYVTLAIQSFINARIERIDDGYVYKQAYTDHLREHFRKVWVLHSYTPASPSRYVRVALGQTLGYQGKAIHSTRRHRQYRKPKIIIVIY